MKLFVPTLLLTLFLSLAQCAPNPGVQASLLEALQSIADGKPGPKYANKQNNPSETTCPFLCPPGQVIKPNPKHVPSSNGCGSSGFQVKSNHGLSDCCDRHDHCYDTVLLLSIIIIKKN
jgi:hypothetical protein